MVWGGYEEDRASGTRVIDLGAMLAVADLSEADLRWTDLSEANLIRANLYRADLVKANLSRTILYQANLSDADLMGARLFLWKCRHSYSSHPHWQTRLHHRRTNRRCD